MNKRAVEIAHEIGTTCLMNIHERTVFIASHLEEYAEEAVAKRDAETCAWEYSDPDFNEWSSMCGASFRFDEGTALENGMKRCMRCGKIIVETINPLIDYETDEWKGDD